MQRVADIFLERFASIRAHRDVVDAEHVDVRQGPDLVGTQQLILGCLSGRARRVTRTRVLRAAGPREHVVAFAVPTIRLEHKRVESAGGVGPTGVKAMTSPSFIFCACAERDRPIRIDKASVAAHARPDAPHGTGVCGQAGPKSTEKCAP